MSFWHPPTLSILTVSGKTLSSDETSVDQIIHRCLMCLGDLSRYQLDLAAGSDKDRICSVSRRYYHQALALRPQMGLPYNQLATLALDLNFGLNSVFYYLRRYLASVVNVIKVATAVGALAIYHTRTPLAAT